ncbi:MAG TPA: hypothetical protein VEL79_22990 [Vicinamibacterales bacterium]|nr:hypothetical protein [Vicinamibacterales bacterium]
MKKKIAAFFGLLLLVFGLQQRDHVACPDWDIYVVDQDGKPMAGVGMNIYSSDPTVEGESTALVRVTDGQGHVFVPRRVIRASRLRAIYGTLEQLPALAHAEIRANGYASIQMPDGYGLPNPHEPGEGGAYWYEETRRVVSRVVLYQCVQGVRRVHCKEGR